MQFTESLRNLEPLSAYGEYSEQGTLSAKKAFVPVNHLGAELSPYLLMHASNPVGWFSWCQEAFDTAKREDRPIFLSIGYFSEHWCRVMERDCFRDKEVAGLLNDTCIPVCVDREERPDINDLFTEVCRLQNGSAGWPLNIFLTPEGRPFFCTTWLPKRKTGQMPGITELLPRIKWLWHVQREDVEREADNLCAMTKQRLETLSCEKLRGGRIGKLKAFEAVSDLRSVFDVKWGGFGGVPKLPEAHKLSFLLRLAKDDSGASSRDKSDAFTMTDITLRRMWRGGIHDHLGGGFSRYAVDESWLVPHFEKLLCDQAMLLYAVARAQALQDNSFHRLFAEDIIFCATKYFCTDASYSQGFCASVCGDTDEGEGRYYLWGYEEVKANLPENLSGLFCAAYAVLPSGNFGSELAGSQMGQNILYEASTVTELAKRYGIKGGDVGVRLYECRRLLLEARDKRYPLRADGKILMGWNGLMIGALAYASVVFEQAEWRDIAERSALFVVKNVVDKSGNWKHRWIDGHADIPALAEDYAYFLWGIVELYKAAKHFNAGERQLDDWLKGAQEIADAMIANCWDEKNGGLFLTGTDKNIFARMKSCEDNNSLPSANSLAALALTDLAVILQEKKYSDYARKIIECFCVYARENPLSCLSLIISDLDWKNVKKKPAPLPKPVLTDEELNAEVPDEQPSQEQAPEEKKSSRSSRRSSRTEHSDRTERRRAGRKPRDR